MSTTDLYADLIRRAEACEAVSDDRYASAQRHYTAQGEASAYRHAAELLRGAVAAAVEEEREACARVADLDERAPGLAPYAHERIADAIRARGESPRGDAASGGREGAE